MWEYLAYFQSVYADTDNKSLILHYLQVIYFIILLGFEVQVHIQNN